MTRDIMSDLRDLFPDDYTDAEIEEAVFGD